MTRALEPEVFDAICAAIEPLLRVPIDDHLSAATTRGCSTGSVSAGPLIRLVTGASWVDIEAIIGYGCPTHAVAVSRRVDRRRRVQPARCRSPAGTNALIGRRYRAVIMLWTIARSLWLAPRLA
jgi:hypothetical protein